uniref:Uncharacterized protein n=1 Tax=viral metagenome TaxID=1070528 RepID=A0A6M3LGI9_9ZZZZ
MNNLRGNKHTHYLGTNFRSRLEARWAVVFEQLGIRWSYEHEWLDVGDNAEYPYWYNTEEWVPSIGYLPDFLVHIGRIDVWWEVKGRRVNADERIKAERLSALTGIPVIIAQGAIPWKCKFSVEPTADYSLEACGFLDDCPMLTSQWLVDEGLATGKYKLDQDPTHSFTPALEAAYRAARSASFDW